MTLWQEIRASALVGSERKPWRAPVADGPLAGLLSGLSGEPAEILLKAAALTSLHDRAGRLPRTSERELPPACPADNRPRCGPRAVWHLRSMLAGNFSPVLPEWLAAVVASGQRVPEEWVPALLRFAIRQHRDLVTAAVGPLASWLELPIAQSRPLVDAASVDWDTGTIAERMALLEYLRRNDPAAAVERIQSTWKVDKADQRKDFMRTLEQGLSQADEVFLETALDDKSVVARRAAADLLARIHGSALSQRVGAAVSGCLKVVTKGMLLNRKRAIEVTLLSDLTAALARDGVEAKGAPEGIGEKAWWTMQAVGLVPPSIWVESLAMTPDQLLEAAARGEDNNLLTMAWAVATLRHKRTDWARAILLAESPPPTQVKELFELLPPSDKEEVALSDKTDRAGLYVGLCQHPWSAAFTRAIVKRIANWPPHSLRELGRFANIDLQDELPADASPGLLEFAAVLRFRREMLQAIESRQ